MIGWKRRGCTGPVPNGSSRDPQSSMRKNSHGQRVFHAIDYIPPQNMPDEEYPMYLTTGRVIYHYHTGTMTRKTEGLNERSPESFVEISAQDAETYTIEDGDLLKISSRRGEIEAKAKLSEKAVKGHHIYPISLCRCRC